eukprot:GGOE01018235.1.p1 GENE.GGOE01018235.1~~GGOE01018235.1.p1  ORF type:complete len:762 (+),score=229.44 GGOE01018235.1:196-2286(+)
MADEAYCVGPAPSAQSYLRIEKLLEVIKKTGTEAVHPGYGFLSENAEFSRALAAEGVVFIGPHEKAIHAMGDKIQSKKLAKSLGVNIIPGFDGEILNEQQLLQVSNEIGYPVMMKASAGGGGKGMRIANNDEEALTGFALCKTEALASFGDDRMLVEKFITQPRHIEIQIIADKVGNTVYLPERECSIQRRNQKVIEEAPSTFIDQQTRESMGKQAAMLARGVEYHTAGTVEMMVDKDRNFYFLEMNTRLQVEHPITELITGVDLVEEMLRAAAGLPLSITQETVKINGWATESRVYAEDPLNNFLPVIGRLNTYREPKHVPGVRIDSGIVEGSEISIYYDPLISKLCTWGPTRQESLSRMAEALDSYVVRGLARTNVNFLRDLMTHPKYISGDITTKFIEQEFPQGYKGHVLTEAETVEMFCVSAVTHSLQELHLWHTDGKKAAHAPLSKRWVVKLGGRAAVVDIQALATDRLGSLPEETYQSFQLSVFPLGKAEDGKDPALPFKIPQQAALIDSLMHSSMGQSDAYYHSKVNADEVDLNAGLPAPIRFRMNINPEHTVGPIMSYQLLNLTNETVDPIVRTTQLLSSMTYHYNIQFMGSQYNVSVMTPLQYHLVQHMLPPPVIDMTKELQSPMPGVVVGILVKPGDKVKAGAPVLVLEAMKMRNNLNVIADATVKEICAKVGDRVDEGQALVLFE